MGITQLRQRQQMKVICWRSGCTRMKSLALKSLRHYETEEVEAKDRTGTCLRCGCKRIRPLARKSFWRCGRAGKGRKTREAAKVEKKQWFKPAEDKEQLVPLHLRNFYIVQTMGRFPHPLLQQREAGQYRHGWFQ